MLLLQLLLLSLLLLLLLLWLTMRDAIPWKNGLDKSLMRKYDTKFVGNEFLTFKIKLEPLLFE